MYKENQNGNNILCVWLSCEYESNTSPFFKEIVFRRIYFFDPLITHNFVDWSIHLFEKQSYRDTESEAEVLHTLAYWFTPEKIICLFFYFL